MATVLSLGRRSFVSIRRFPVDIKVLTHMHFVLLLRLSLFDKRLFL